MTTKLSKLAERISDIENKHMRRQLQSAINARKHLDERYDVMRHRETQLERISHAITIVVSDDKRECLDAIEDWIDVLGPLVPTYGEEWTPEPSNVLDVRQRQYDGKYGKLYGNSYNLQRRRLQYARDALISDSPLHVNDLVEGLVLKIVTWDMVFGEDNYAMTEEVGYMDEESMDEESKEELLNGMQTYR